MGIPAAVMAVSSVLGINESNKARREQKKLAKEQEERDIEDRRKQGQEVYNAKANEYATSRSKDARSKSRGRMSTILGSSKGGTL